MRCEIFQTKKWKVFEEGASPFHSGTLWEKVTTMRLFLTSLSLLLVVAVATAAADPARRRKTGAVPEGRIVNPKEHVSAAESVGWFFF